MLEIPEEKFIEIEEFANKGKIKIARELFQKLLDENPEDLSLKLAFVDFLLRATDDVCSALSILRQGMKIDPEDLDFRYLFAIAQIKAGRFYLAQKELEILLTKQPLSLKLKKELGWVKIMQGQLEQGRKILREVISDNLADPSPYMDLGVSFINTFDFKEAFQWLETAKGLNPKDPLVLNALEHAKKTQEEFEKFSAKDKEKIRRMRTDPQQLKEESIQNTLKFAAKAGKLSQEDMEDTRKELELAGFDPNFGMFASPTTKAEKEQVEYLQYHQKVQNVERKISQQEFEDFKEKLLNANLKLPLEDAKKILIVLGHQGTKEAIVLLRMYRKKAPKPLKKFVQMALRECEIFSQDNHSNIIPFSI
ncbi:hypothetical protein COZ78_03570 [bacterium (Candidatus Gribaldobacteria) CG_4_8_14_3_um_filter_42_11]|uniref:Uncharacterized protein n=2 Tax=Candidatus Gribaldobacteria TaxID=2798536 RepID=A0A2H0UXY2_9BACT|nr:MAG: hypothetical protein AUJ36_03045 [Parcubacteria group bacterium CG1_02_41_26]PIR91673.1 MAG: hypothetical protein COU03_01145 [bacterium (Candidatus Gribaldobacteria) CG10_big_fil_rev_8_21_14_0_10_41_12]PIX02845.1 MAG: hypothetical protein COZ78_03570 [bacterium (Candidatus Gribaldobacteria) CG_4_8_14_3_um_filter_42_11]